MKLTQFTVEETSKFFDATPDQVRALENEIGDKLGHDVEVDSIKKIGDGKFQAFISFDHPKTGKAVHKSFPFSGRFGKYSVEDFVAEQVEGTQETLLGELVELREAETVDTNRSYELSDLAKYFPKTFNKVVQKFEATDRILWNGHPIFGEATQNMFDDAAEEAFEELNDGDFDIDVNVDPRALARDDEFDGDQDDLDDFEITVPLEVNDPNLVYMGYDPRHNEIYLGYDAGVASNVETILNDDFDDEFEKHTGVQFDYNNPVHREIYEGALRFLPHNFAVMIAIDENGHARLEGARPGIFYPSMYHEYKEDHGLKDLILS